jgi:hypothetical protein
VRRFWVHLYPTAWRARYGDDLADDLARTPLRLSSAVDLLRGALDARLHPELANAAGLSVRRRWWWGYRSRLGALASPLLALAIVLGLSGGAQVAGNQDLGSRAQPNFALVGAPPALPAAGASLATWEAFAAGQTKWIESQPFAAEYAAKGLTVVKVTFIPVLKTPGAPAGVTTMAASVLALPKAGQSG